MFTAATESQVVLELKLVEGLVDVADHSRKLRKKKKQLHPHQEIRRGRGYVETIHAQIGDNPATTCS